MEDFQLDLIIGEGPGGAFGEDRPGEVPRWSARNDDPAC